MTAGIIALGCDGMGGPRTARYRNRHSVALAIFLGGMLSLTTVMSTYKINAWIGSYIVPGMEPFADNIWLLVLALAVGVALMRFIDPIGFMTLAAFILSLAAFSTTRGIPPLVLTAIVLLPVHVFWFNYQNIWLAMTDGITKRSAFSEGQRLTLAQHSSRRRSSRSD